MVPTSRISSEPAPAHSTGTGCVNLPIRTGRCSSGNSSSSLISIRHALATSLRTVWSDLIERFQKSVAAPQTDQPFRGTLVDPKMFAIDVNEWGERDLYRELCDSYPHPLQEINTTRSKE